MYRKGEKSKESQDARNSSVLRSWFQRWVWASYANFDHVEKEIVRDKKNYSLIKHHKKHIGEPAIIVGAGISLEKLIPLLKDWKGVIFAPESMASTMQYYGHQAEYICLFDANQTAWDLFLAGYNWKGSTLVTHPSVDPKAIEKWKHDKIYYLMMHFARLNAMPETEGKNLLEVEKEVKEQLLGFDFFENILPMVYKHIGASILNAGCVVNNAIEVANFMGYGPLFLCGVDFGFKDWIDRYPQMKKVGGRWKKDDLRIVEHEEAGKKVGIPIGREIIISDNGIPTTDEMSEYKLALMSVYKLDRPQLFDCSDGIITELPKADIKEVVEKNGEGFEDRYRTDEEIVRSSNDYFNRR
ncbi:MAG: DUF115 domain-containing protein [Candidatus Cloacimonetes bacterium]|nr:DUF115 domain-containing protein [Candidatus Cloacimonadota bacterium]